MKMPLVPWKQARVPDQVGACRVALFEFAVLLLNATCRAWSRGLQGAHLPTEHQLSLELLELESDGGI